MPNDRPKKLQRVSQACDLCHRRSIRCRPSVENPSQQCQNCYDFAVDCTYQRPSRRRRNRSKTHVAAPNITSTQQDLTSPYSSSTKAERAVHNPADASTRTTTFGQISQPFVHSQNDASSDDCVDIAWRCFAIASPQVIDENLRVYMETVYPLMPVFHGPTMWEQVHQRRHLEDRSFFASIMAACALAAAGSRDGAIENTKLHRGGNVPNPTDMFFNAARDAIFKDPDRSTSFSYLRACALLALTSMQSGQLPAMHLYLGHYVTLSAVQRFYDEPSWPANLSVVDREERRRLFWSVYNLDVLSSIVFDAAPKCQEVHSNVAYPSEVSDEALMHGTTQQTVGISWLRGWNVATDLYRIMEITSRRLQWYKNNRLNQPAIDRLSGYDTTLDDGIIDHVVEIYYNLPEELRNPGPRPTAGDRPDILGVQAVNVQATFQLARVMLLNLIQIKDVHQRCEVVGQMLSIFQGMPRSYLQALGVPLVLQIAAIGQMFAPDLHGILTEEIYTRVRALLESLIKLLEELERGLHAVANLASQRIRALTGRMDQHMQSQQHMLSTTAALQVATPVLQIPVKVKASVYGTSNLIRQAHTPKSRMPVDEFQLNRGLGGDWPTNWPFDFSQEPDGSTLNG